MSVDDDGDEWLRPIDLMVDSDAPEQIALELGRQARALPPRGAATRARRARPRRELGSRRECAPRRDRYLTSQPWLAHPSLEPAVAAVEDASARRAARDRGGSATASRPRYRSAARADQATRAAAVGDDRRQHGRPQEAGRRRARARRGTRAPNVTEWTVRVSVRPDPRQDYVEGEARDAAGRRVRVRRSSSTSFRAGSSSTATPADGRIVRRAIISALTSGNSGAQWKRQATAS